MTKRDIYCILIVIYSLGFLYISVTTYFAPAKNKTESTADDHGAASALPLCPAMPPGLQGKVDVRKDISLPEAEAALKDSVALGGTYSSTSCQSRWKVAIITAFRNRNQHLGPFNYHIHKFLQKQQLSYAIFLVNQTDNEPFNRAKLFNVGFTEATKLQHYDCIIFHDVDFMPENDLHLYHCTPMPRHLTVNYSHPYGNDKDFVNKYFGGVVMFTEEHLRLINGWSNRFWGWGGEDDDLKKRIEKHKLPIWRYPKHIGVYSMLSHKKAKKNPKRYKLLKETDKVASKDGLNSLKYKLLGTEKRPLFTVFHADIS